MPDPLMHRLREKPRQVVNLPHLSHIRARVHLMESDRKAGAAVGGRDTVAIDARLWHQLVQIVGA